MGAHALHLFKLVCLKKSHAWACELENTSVRCCGEYEEFGMNLGEDDVYKRLEVFFS